ncbi:MAG: hydroxymethylpyrimidine/phosphomethylpyrimidine kinase [Gammaproteobacteria bacterium]
MTTALSTHLSEASPPIVMCFSGLDPTGGAGIQADIETCLTLGVHCTPIITALTVQDTRNASHSEAVNPNTLIAQARAVLEDIPVNVFKVGLINSHTVAQALHTLFTDYADIPVIFDPVLSAGGGHPFGNEQLIEQVRTFLLPHTHLLLPNIDEAKKLAPEADTLEACAHELMDSGCEYVLITGTHAHSTKIEHQLYGHNQLMQSFDCERLPNTYHGSGCTLASAVACHLAHGLNITQSCREAQTFTFRTLKHAKRLGMGQLIPHRAAIHATTK